MTLREMTVDDIDAVTQIEKLLFHDPWTREGLFTYLAKDNTLFLVVEERGRLLGYIGFLYVLDEGDILNVGVIPERQGEGIGAFILTGLTRLASSLGIKTFHLEVRAGNARALRLYERMGFCRDGLRKNYYTDPTEDAVLMTLHLPEE